MRQKKRGTVCIYEDKRSGRWRVQVTRADRTRTTHTVVTKELAEEIASHARRQMADEVQTIAEAIEMYLAELKARGTKESHRVAVRARLRLIYPDGDRLLCELHPVLCQRLYDEARSKGKSVDYHRNALLTARSMCKWMVKRGHLRSNPWEGIEGVGKRRRGKRQLTIDESRRFMAACLEDESLGATMALCCLVLGMRAGEIAGLSPRGIDDGGRLLRIDEAKTDAGVRLIEVPDFMQDRLPALAAARVTRHMVNHHIRRMCRAAGVTEVGPHALRGTHASLATRAGASSQLVAATLGHASTQVTHQHYTQPEAVRDAGTKAALTLLQGGASESARESARVPPKEKSPDQKAERFQCERGDSNPHRRTPTGT